MNICTVLQSYEKKRDKEKIVSLRGENGTSIHLSTL